MKITQLLTEETIILNLDATSKQQVLEELTGQLEQAGKLVRPPSVPEGYPNA